ncbi:MAG: orotidine-5'-phosphate decarboxylase [Acidobacteriota bacterium]|nr:orotidine-5'-phosphate decarboxylase [Acidobacteriota bacterium]
MSVQPPPSPVESALLGPVHPVDTVDPLNPLDRLIVALDFPAAAEALAFVHRLDGVCRWVKVGMELFYSAGPPVVEQLRALGFQVFLDLKLHDIPNTVAGAVRSVAGCGASLLTVHAGGGEAMMRAAEAAANTPGSGRLLAVTVLTSMDAAQLSGVGVPDGPAAQVMRLARLAKSCGISGLVCSSEELVEVRRELGPEALLVVPGIRPEGVGAGDQRRTATPLQAIRAGASMLVVGRPITRAADPAEAAAAILAEMAGQAD